VIKAQAITGIKAGELFRVNQPLEIRPHIKGKFTQVKVHPLFYLLYYLKKSVHPLLL
jgi:hypothetical protein